MVACCRCYIHTQMVDHVMAFLVAMLTLSNVFYKTSITDR